MDRWNFDNPLQGKVKPEWISDKIDQTTVAFAKEFGTYLAKDDIKIKLDKERRPVLDKDRKPIVSIVGDKLTTSQLRRFFGEVKYCKIEDFYTIIDDAVMIVVNSNDTKNAFKNFIAFFEAIVAYHKAEVKEK